MHKKVNLSNTLYQYTTKLPHSSILGKQNNYIVTFHDTKAHFYLPREYSTVNKATCVIPLIVACKNIKTTKQTHHFYIISMNLCDWKQNKWISILKAFCGHVQHSTPLIPTTYLLAKIPHPTIILWLLSSS